VDLWYSPGRSQWQRNLKHELSSLARTLGSWVRIPLKAWMSVCVYSVFVLSCVGSGLATGWSPIQGVLLTVLRLRKWSETKRFTGALCSSGSNRKERERGIDLVIVIIIKLWWTMSMILGIFRVTWSFGKWTTSVIRCKNLKWRQSLCNVPNWNHFYTWRRKQIWLQKRHIILNTWYH
jgi:hypothetical protein